MAKTDLTHDEVRSLLDYDPETGIFVWRVALNSRAKAGSIAGSIHKRVGYNQIRIDGQKYQAHRLAWFYVYGVWPKHQIDHIDGSKANNAIANLREATPSQNQANRGIQKNNRLGIKGVCRHRNRFRAAIRDHGRTIYLGMFDTPEEANAAYFAAAIKRHGEFARNEMDIPNANLSTINRG